MLDATERPLVLRRHDGLASKTKKKKYDKLILMHFGIKPIINFHFLDHIVKKGSSMGRSIQLIKAERFGV